MKKSLLTLAFATLAVMAQAQMPQTFGYQVAVRNSSGVLLKNQQIGVRVTIFSIPQADTMAYYREKHTVTTDNFGVATMNIMGGTVEFNYMANSGGFEGIINDAAKPSMLVEIDPAGGTNYTLKSSAQLLPVPYAAYAQKANAAQTAAEAEHASSANSSTTAQNVTGNIGDVPLVNVKVIVVGGDAQTSGSVNFLGQTINIGQEQTFKIPAYSPIYISKITKGIGGNYSYTRDVKVNGTRVNAAKSTTLEKSSFSTNLPVKLASEGENVYIATNGNATTIDGESMKPLYGTTKDQDGDEFNFAVDSYESVLYVESPNYYLTTSSYSNSEDIINLLVGPLGEGDNTIRIEYTKVIY